MLSRLILHSDSILKSDVHTFKAAGLLLLKEYKRLYPNHVVRLEFVRSGQDIVRHIQEQSISSIASLDLVSHGNQGGIHIARKLAAPVASGFLQRRAHAAIRSNSERPQTEADAEQIEESMHGLYTDWMAKKGVSYYYNQTYDSSQDTSILSDIAFDRFTNDCHVEFHGCRTAEVIPGLNTYFKDNFAKQFSQNLGKDSLVVGHVYNSNPNKTPTGKFSDYRHGIVRAYRQGRLIGGDGERNGQKYHNSSTP